MDIRKVRNIVWHFRHGGFKQVREYQRRQKLYEAMPDVIVAKPGFSLPNLKRRLAGQPVKQSTADFISSLAPWPAPQRTPHRDVRVGIIADSFTEAAFAPEWEHTPLTRENYRELIDHGDLDLVFVESAWHGSGGSWRFALSKGPDDDLCALVELARHRSIPTVFWNKEDPVHFEDFLDCARLFDYVFTTDCLMLDDYRSRLGHDHVGVLEFAAQPAIHNPIRPQKGYSSRDIAFAGTYYTQRFPERRAQMNMLLSAADTVGEDLPIGLEIFSRFLGDDPAYQFPAPLKDRVIGSVNYERMLSVYRLYKVFLNVNSVTESPSMCARRIFEILACGSSVVTTPSAATSEFFDTDELAVVASKEEATDTIRALVANKQLRDRMNHRAQRRIWGSYTYRHRVDTILAAVGLSDHVEKSPVVTAIVSTIRPHNIAHVLETVAAMNHVGGITVQLCVATHGFRDDSIVGRAAELGLSDTVVLECSSDMSLGECLNALVARADGDIIAKIDDDDIYGPHYLLDQVNALGFSGADVVGKQAHYSHLGSLDAVALANPGREHCYTHMVAGPTLVTYKHVLDNHPFPPVTVGEDSGFLHAVTTAGLTVYSADRFNFIRQRHDEGHTWDIDQMRLASRAAVETFGDGVSHVVF